MPAVAQGWARWRLGALAVHAVLLTVSLAYLWLTVSLAAAPCYVSPCYRGLGLQELWKVDKGVSASCVLGGLVGSAQAAAGVYCFLRSRGGVSHFAMGLFAGLTVFLACLMLGQAALWTAQWNLVYDLAQISPDSELFEESGRHMVVRDDLRGKFRSLTALAATACACHLVVCVCLILA